MDPNHYESLHQPLNYGWGFLYNALVPMLDDQDPIDHDQGLRASLESLAQSQQIQQEIDEELRADLDELAQLRHTLASLQQEVNKRLGFGLTEETISALLPTTTKQGNIHLNSCEADEEEEDICAICLCEYEQQEMIGTLECGHVYHEQCIKKWLLQKNVCPLCKATALSV